MPGHTLVVPVRHVEHPDELREAEVLAVFQAIRYVRTRLPNSVAEGIDIRQNYRPFIAQSRLKVDHVHFHILPRTNEDELYQKSMVHEAAVFMDLEPAERDKFVELLKGDASHLS